MTLVVVCTTLYSEIKGKDFSPSVYYYPLRSVYIFLFWSAIVTLFVKRQQTRKILIMFSCS